MQLEGRKVLVTGGAGFIGSNLCELLLESSNEVVCFDNYSTGKRENLEICFDYNSFKSIEGDIRDIETCRKAVKGTEIVFHQAALGSVPRSLKDPITTNEVNVSGFLNVLQASVESSVKRFIYAASSSTYGDSTELPKMEEKIGAPLSPYAVTKYVNELYASVFSTSYGIETLGLRYFNVFGRKQDPDGAYAAVIPKFIQTFMDHRSPTINGDGSYSRDFTYIDNVLQANILAASTPNEEALNSVYNVAYGERNNLNQMVESIKKALTKFDPEIENVKINYGPFRKGDIPHSLASIEKAKLLLGYDPSHSFEQGIQEAIAWYWNNITTKK
ncbi:MAG: SDR family oxidoreductase [Bacteroidota bacterium]